MVLPTFSTGIFFEVINVARMLTQEPVPHWANASKKNDLKCQSMFKNG